MMSFKDVVQENRKKGYKYPYIFEVNGDTVIEVERRKVQVEDGEDYQYFKKGVVCRTIRILSSQRDINTNETEYTLEYLTPSLEKRQITVKAEILANSRTIVELAKYSVDVSSLNANSVIKHISNELTKVSSCARTKEIGFIKNNDKECMFVSNRCYIKENDEIRREDVQYNGTLDLSSKGSYKTYKSLINNEVVVSVPLSLALIMGLTAPILSFIGEECNVNNIILHISGDSTSGKSTALKVAISCFGPISTVGNKSSLFSSWNLTENAMMEALAGVKGIPIAFDEAGMSRSKNFTSLIYKLSSGREKLRLNFGKGNNEIRTWSTVILSSGEIPIDDDNSDRATGAGIRLISLDGIQWTKSAEEADYILQEIEENHGFLGNKVALMLMKLGKDKVVEIHKIESEKLLNELTCGKFSPRISNTLAMFMTTVRIVQKLGINIDKEKISELLINEMNRTHGINSSLGDRAREYVLAEIARNQQKLEKRAVNGYVLESPCGEVWAVAYGRKIGDSDFTVEEVALEKHMCDTLLKENGFHNVKEVYRQWLKNNFIKPNNKGGDIHKIKLGGINTSCIRILIPEELVYEE